ncbi:hypothetical protein B7486_07925 [cyanobacterium TDX16]|nr:hypothetical protein B7486_07925 [cyanobacterium TDX16]
MNLCCITDHAATLATSMPTTATAQADVSQVAVCFFEFYSQNLRASFFSGFLTLGSFLAAVNTFIVVNLKKELYDNPRYRDRVKKRKPLNKNITYFAPLRRLSRFLLAVIIMSILTAVSQLTIGLIPSTKAAVFCIVMAAITVVLLFCVLVSIGLNLRSWFQFMEDEACEKPIES